MMEIKTRRTKHSRALAVCFAVTVQVATIIMCFTAVWMALAPDSKPAEIRLDSSPLSSTLRMLLLGLDPSSYSAARIASSITKSGWPTGNNAIRLSSSVMVMLFGLLAYVIAPFISVKQAYIGFLVWLSIALILICTSFALDIKVMDDTFTQCQSTTCPSELMAAMENESTRCSCSFNPWYWVSIGFEAALLLMLVLSIVGLVVGLVKGTPQLVMEDEMYGASASSHIMHDDGELHEYKNVYEPAEEDEQAYLPRDVDEMGDLTNGVYEEPTSMDANEKEGVYTGDY